MLPLYGIIKCQTCGYMFAVCVLLRQEQHPALWKVPFAAALGESCLVFLWQRAEAAALSARSWAVAAEQISQKPSPPAAPA